MILALLACGGSAAPSIEVPGVKATVPADAVPLHGASREALVAGTTRSDPAADVSVEGVAPAGRERDLLYAVLRVHRSPGLDGGMSVEEWTRANQTALEDHGRSKHIETTSEVRCEGEVCLFEYSLGGALFHRSQMSMEGGRMLTVSCQCVEPGCLDACSLPAP